MTDRGKRGAANRLLLFVCTGNVCRSPMAERLMRARLPAEAGWTVSSAGLLATAGQPASPEAVATLRARNLDLRAHRSRPLTTELVDAATLIVVMTRIHRAQVELHFPDARDKVYLLKTFDPQAAEPDVDDPIGAPVGVYAETCRQLEAALPGLAQYLETFSRAGGTS